MPDQRDQVRRDAGESVASAYLAGAETLAAHCLSLLAELGQVEQREAALVEAARAYLRGSAGDPTREALQEALAAFEEPGVTSDEQQRFNTWQQTVDHGQGYPVRRRPS